LRQHVFEAVQVLDAGERRRVPRDDRRETRPDAALDSVRAAERMTGTMRRGRQGTGGA
jgi:hypothetical protein